MKATIKCYEKNGFSDIGDCCDSGYYFGKFLPVSKVFIDATDRSNNSFICSLLEIYAIQEPACHKL